MKMDQTLLRLSSLDKKTKIAKILSSLLAIGFVFIPSESKLLGQGVVDIFTCSPITAVNYCRHTIYNGTASARAEFHCSGWESETLRGVVTAVADTSCSNGVPVKNIAQVGDRDTYVDGWISADATYGPVLRTITSGALFCNRIWTPPLTESYPEGCNRPRNGGGGCLSGLTTSGEVFKEDDPANICSPCDPDPADIFMCQQGGGVYDWASCQCGQSPIVIDVLGNGYNLTSAVSGVRFDINGDGTQDQVAWSAVNSDDAWLSLDRDGNGTIDSGKELFGNSTSQPAPPVGTAKNGFLALAVFDKTANGGNDDGKIDRLDGIFANLRLWQDSNHNGISESYELKSLTESGLANIDLDYRESRRTDEHGNRFKYRAKVRDVQGAQLGRWAWDVYLVVQQSSN